MTEEIKRPRRVVSQLVLMEDPATAGEVRAWADLLSLPMTAILRQALRRGLMECAPTWELQAGRRPTNRELYLHSLVSIKTDEDREAWEASQTEAAKES